MEGETEDDFSADDEEDDMLSQDLAALEARLGAEVSTWLQIILY